MTERVIHTPADFDAFVDEIISILPQKDNAHVLALTGDLGAGKTTFTQALARKLGITEHVTSPTFVIMRLYETQNKQFKKLVHIDAYRIEDIKEMEVLHIPELFKEKDSIVCIEWPEKITSLIPGDALKIKFEVNDDESRTITYN